MGLFGRRNRKKDGADTSGKPSQAEAPVPAENGDKKSVDASHSTEASQERVSQGGVERASPMHESLESQLSTSTLSCEAHPREPTPKNFLSGSRFKCKEYINRGATSFVVMAVDSTNDKKYALKFIPLASTKSKYVEREIINQFKLKHPHIIKLEELFVTEDHLVLVLEYADKGDLFSYLRRRGRLREDSARWFFQQIVLAIDFCHRMGVVNRDIKLENVLLSSVSSGSSSSSGKGSRQKIAKLSDFGFSKDETRHSAPNTRLGTLMYIAPEVMTNKPKESYDAKKTDVWSAGVVLYVMLAGQYPFLAGSNGSADDGGEIGVKKMRELLSRTVKNDFEKVQGISNECHDLLCRMLEPDPAKRISISEVMKSTWYCAGMSAGVSGFNEKVVSQLEKRPRVTEETVANVRKILQGGAKLTIMPQRSGLGI